jgi:hypothetical protein
MRELTEEDRKNIEELITNKTVGCEFLVTPLKWPQRLVITDDLFNAEKEHILIERGQRPAIDPYHSEEDVKRLAGPYVAVGNVSPKDFSILALVMARKKSYIFDSREGAFQWIMSPFKEN